MIVPPRFAALALLALPLLSCANSSKVEALDLLDRSTLMVSPGSATGTELEVGLGVAESGPSQVNFALHRQTAPVTEVFLEGGVLEHSDGGSGGPRLNSVGAGAKHVILSPSGSSLQVALELAANYTAAVDDGSAHATGLGGRAGLVGAGNWGATRISGYVEAQAVDDQNDQAQVGAGVLVGRWLLGKAVGVVGIELAWPDAQPSQTSFLGGVSLPLGDPLLLDLGLQTTETQGSTSSQLQVGLLWRF